MGIYHTCNNTVFHDLINAALIFSGMHVLHTNSSHEKLQQSLRNQLWEINRYYIFIHAWVAQYFWGKQWLLNKTPVRKIELSVYRY